jgi:hypothetical protein
VSILVEIAGRADVSVEGVVRVLTREPVSSAVKERVLAVLDQLDAEQTRVLERFALAAVHDVMPLESDDEPSSPEGTDASEPSVHEGQLALGEAPPAQHPTLDSAGNGGPDRAALSEAELPVGLGTLLEELVAAVWEIRHESRSNRQERLNDLAVLVDLMTTSWQGVDRRLARLEQLGARREAPWPPPAAAAAQFERSMLQHVLEAPPPPPPPAEDEPSRGRRSWPPFAGTLLLLVCLIGALLVFDLLPSSADSPSLLPVRENGADGTQTTPTVPTTSTGSSSARSRSTRPSAPAQTTAPGRTTAPTKTEPTPQAPSQAPAAQRPRATSTQARREAAPPPVTTPTTTSSATIEPARVFVWPPVEGASAYSVRFFHEGEAFYTARVSEPRLAIPKRIVFQPGTYRWVVRPDTGNGLGSPIIESTFSVARR